MDLTAVIHRLLVQGNRLCLIRLAYVANDHFLHFFYKAALVTVTRCYLCGKKYAILTICRADAFCVIAHPPMPPLTA